MQFANNKQVTMTQDRDQEYQGANDSSGKGKSHSCRSSWLYLRIVIVLIVIVTAVIGVTYLFISLWYAKGMDIFIYLVSIRYFIDYCIARHFHWQEIFTNFTKAHPLVKISSK